MYDMAFSADGGRLALVGEDSSVCILDLRMWGVCLESCCLSLRVGCSSLRIGCFFCVLTVSSAYWLLTLVVVYHCLTDDCCPVPFHSECLIHPLIDDTITLLTFASTLIPHKL